MISKKYKNHKLRRITFIRNTCLLTFKYDSFKSSKKGCKPLNQFQPWFKSMFSIKPKNLSLAPSHILHGADTLVYVLISVLFPSIPCAQVIGGKKPREGIYGPEIACELKRPVTVRLEK